MGHEIFKSKRFWSGFLGMVFMMLVAYVPQLAEHQESLTQAIMVVVGLMIGGYSIEDAMTAYKGNGGLTMQEVADKIYNPQGSRATTDWGGKPIIMDQAAAEEAHPLGG